MVAYQVMGKTIIKDPAICPHCFRTATGHKSIIKIFGLRNMDDGTTRVQSWCKDCRKGATGGNVQ